MGIDLETLPVYASTVHEEPAMATTDGTECIRYNITGLIDPGILYESLHMTLFLVTPLQAQLWPRGG